MKLITKEYRFCVGLNPVDNYNTKNYTNIKIACIKLFNLNILDIFYKKVENEELIGIIFFGLSLFLGILTTQED